LRTGLKEEDMSKPQVGISSMWYEGNPCNMHLLSLAEHVKAGVVSTTQTPIALSPMAFEQVTEAAEGTCTC
jgi:dihydroxyacid dehydratase/phosphogluconate dehydratase